MLHAKLCSAVVPQAACGALRSTRWVEHPRHKVTRHAPMAHHRRGMLAGSTMRVHMKPTLR